MFATFCLQCTCAGRRPAKTFGKLLVCNNERRARAGGLPPARSFQREHDAALRPSRGQEHRSRCREGIRIHVSRDPEQVQRETAIRARQMVVRQLPDDRAVHAAFEACRVAVSLLARNEVEWDPDPALVPVVAVR